MEVTAAFYFSRGPRSDSGADRIGLKFSALENLPGIGVLRRGDEILGEVTHVNTLAGHENRSVMYVAPRSLGEVHGEPGGVSLIQQIKYLIPFSWHFFF